MNPRDTAARFAREFEEEYGSHSLHFFEHGYAQAFDEANKELKFLVVVLISPEHDDTSTFIRETLLSQEVADYINDPQNNIILWAGNVQDSEAYQVSSALNCSKFPFTALIAHTPQDSSTSMSTIARISGLLPPSAFVPRLRTAITQHSAALDRVRATRNEQQAARNIREEQNSAYERSLAQDRERAQRRREADAEKTRLEAEEKARLGADEKKRRDLEQWRSWRAQTIAPEPGPKADSKAIARISIRMTSGERILRKFTATAHIEELYAFVECHDVLETPGSELLKAEKPEGYEHEYKFRLVSPMPRVVYDLDFSDPISSRIGRSGNLIVEPIADDDEV